MSKKMMILLILYVLTYSLVGCGKDDETTNTGKNTTQQQTTESNKTTEDNITTTEEVVTTEAINQLPVDMSVMGADSAEQALELFKEALNNDDANIAKKISFILPTSTSVIFPARAVSDVVKTLS